MWASFLLFALRHPCGTAWFLLKFRLHFKATLKRTSLQWDITQIYSFNFCGSHRLPYGRMSNHRSCSNLVFMKIFPRSRYSQVCLTKDNKWLCTARKRAQWRLWTNSVHCCGFSQSWGNVWKWAGFCVKKKHLDTKECLKLTTLCFVHQGWEDLKKNNVNFKSLNLPTYAGSCFSVFIVKSLKSYGCKRKTPGYSILLPLHFVVSQMRHCWFWFTTLWLRDVVDVYIVYSLTDFLHWLSHGNVFNILTF